jgi:two-component system response regulator AtoC
MIPSMPEILPKILVVDDDRHTRILFDRLLARTAVVSLAVDGAEARRLFAAEDFNLVLMDQRLPSDNGIDLLREFRARRPHLVGILMTGFADVRDAVAAVREGVFDYLTKPFEDLEALEAVIGKALELDRAYREIHGLRARLSSESGTPEVSRSRRPWNACWARSARLPGSIPRCCWRVKAVPARNSRRG